MLTMLVVDDEAYALKGITEAIDWSDLPLSAIREADSARAAMDILEREPVDLVISDIEMPGENGMELLRWIRDKHPDTPVVFLTGHARFDYAREALQLGCFDYALKPIDHDALKGIVARAIKEIQRRRALREVEATMDVYRRQWTSELPILVERFWQDLLAGRVPPDPDRLNRQFELYGIPLRADGFVLPILLSIEQWDVDLGASDEQIMEYAVRKAALETIAGDAPGTVLQDRSDLNLLLLYLPEPDAVDRPALLQRCRRYVEACKSYFHSRVSCYVGVPAPVSGLPERIDRLMQAERCNVSAAQSVIDASVAAEGAAGGGGALPSMAEWGFLLENDQQDELLRQLEAAVSRQRDEQTSRETLELLYHGILHLVFQTAHRRGASVYEAATVSELNDPQACRSPQQLMHWAARLIGKAAAAFRDKRDSSAVVAKVNAYIQQNLHRDLSRDEIAAAVYRNPAYLSRLFRKETGLSLSESIAQQRIERAKKLLVETNDKISNIAEGLGYLHFSYFAKLFRKMTGYTPQDYRKKHQRL